MFLRKSLSNNKIYLSIVHGYRDKENKVKQKTILKLGYLDELEKIYDNPISHFKEVAKQMTAEYNDEEKFDFNIKTNRDIEDGELKNLGYFAIKKVYNELTLKEFLDNNQKKLKIEYKLDEILKLLTFNRILFPSSKKEAFDNKNIFFEKFDFSLDDVYRSLDYFNNLKDDLIKHVNLGVESIYTRNKELAYYDVTNYYFEIPYDDQNTYDEDNNLIKKGFRKKGMSKEHRPNPIVQMGLLMDNQGIPITFNLFEGNESEKLSLLPTIKEVKNQNDIDRIIVVADRGLNTSDNTFFLAGFNDDEIKRDGYVFGQTVLGGNKEFKEWVLKQEDYINDKITEKSEQVTFRHKSRVYARKVTIKKDGKRNQEIVTYEKQMVYYSSKYAAKQKKERDLVIAKAKDLIAKPGKYNKSTAYGAAQFINNLKFIKTTGEVATSQELSLKEDKIKELEKYDGYYSIVTSERNLSDLEIRNIYTGLWEIEESFKIIKSEFKARPVYLSVKEHIEAHFLICFLSLVIFRLLEIKLDKKYTVKQIRDTLINYGCTYLEQNVYAILEKDKHCLDELAKLFGLDLSGKYIKLPKIKKILHLK